MSLDIVHQRLKQEHDLPDGFVFWRWAWKPYQLEKPLYLELGGGVCPLVTRGKRKGKPNYRKATDKREFVVTTEQYEQWLRDYEQTTGNCQRCLGSCRVVKSISVAEGTTYRDCPYCQGTGKARENGSDGT